MVSLKPLQPNIGTVRPPCHCYAIGGCSQGVEYPSREPCHVLPALYTTIPQMSSNTASPSNAVEAEDHALLEVCLKHCVVHPSHMLTLLADAMPPAYPLAEDSISALIHPPSWESAASQLWDISTDFLAALFLDTHGIQPLMLATLDGAVRALQHMQQHEDAAHDYAECMAALHRRIEVACGIFANLATTHGGASFDPAVVGLIADDVLGGGQGPPRVTDGAALAEAVRLVDTVARWALAGTDGVKQQGGMYKAEEEGGYSPLSLVSVPIETDVIKKHEDNPLAVLPRQSQEPVALRRAPVHEDWVQLIEAPWLPPLLLWMADNTLRVALFQQWYVNACDGGLHRSSTT